MNIEVSEIDCCNCGIVFWISSKVNQELINSKRSFYCPNGHGQSYTYITNEADRLRKIIANKDLFISDLERRLAQKCKDKRKRIKKS